MPRRRRLDTIPPYHLEKIQRQVGLLEIAMRDAELDLRPFLPHYDALAELHVNIRRALIILNDRPVDHVEPHRAPMSG